MKIKFKLVSLLLLSISGLVSTSFAAESKMSTSTTSASASAAAGASAKVLFQKYCSICHGENGNGKTRVVKSMIPPPRDFTNAQAARELTRKRMIDSVTDGRPGTAMVSHTRKLSTDEIASIVDYIRDNFMKFPQVPKHVASNELIADSGQSANSEQSANSKQSTKGGDNSAGNALTVNTKGNELGREIFKKNCSSCHGDNGNTAFWARSSLDPAPRDFTAPHARVELSYQRMIDSVTNGRPGTAMMPFTSRLSTAEIEAVVAYIRSAFMQIADNDTDTARDGDGNVANSTDSAGKDVMKQQSAPEKEQSKSAAVSAPVSAMSAGMPDQHAEVDMSAVMPSGLSGDFSKGEDFFLNNCYVCHGKKGDGKGPRSHFITPRPRNFTSDASRQVFNRPRLFDSIQKGKKGTVMPAWEKVLNDQQIADVAEYVFKTYIQVDSDAKESPKDVGVEKSSKLNSIPDSISGSKLNGVSDGIDIVKSDEKSEKNSVENVVEKTVEKVVENKVENKVENNAATANKEEKKKATEAETAVSPTK